MADALDPVSGSLPATSPATAPATARRLRRAVRMSGRAILLFLLPVAARTAPVGTDPLAAACAQLEEGRQVRVQTVEGATIEAPLVGSGDDALLLQSAEGVRRVELARIAAVWVRDRQAGRGAVTGTLLGGAAGGLGFWLLAELVEAVGESGTDVEKGPIILAGVGLGAAGGALSGALIGAAVPRWRLVHARNGVATATDAPATSVAPADPRGRIGAIGLAAGGAWNEDGGTDAGGPGGTVTLAAQFPSGLALGLELGLIGIGASPPTAPGPLAPAYETEDTLWHLGGLVRYALGRGPVRPYLTAGLGGYRWEDSFLGASYGAGVTFALRHPRLAARLEYRRHDNIQNLVGADPGFHELTAGLDLAW